MSKTKDTTEAEKAGDDTEHPSQGAAQDDAEANADQALKTADEPATEGRQNELSDASFAHKQSSGDTLPAWEASPEGKAFIESASERDDEAMAGVERMNAESEKQEKIREAANEKAAELQERSEQDAKDAAEEAKKAAKDKG